MGVHPKRVFMLYKAGLVSHPCSGDLHNIMQITVYIIPCT